MNNIISYSQFLKDRDNFRKRSKEDIFDQPSVSFFKILFHFYNGDSDSYSQHNGLLAPTWLDNPNEYDYYMYNSAWSYLKNNLEDERADKLVKFVTLLSTISSECPWYFQDITGLDSAIDRTQIKDFKFDDDRKKISIKCLEDSYDHKIGTLLSLYRDIIWSWSMKREIIPANLRKFDMSIFFWESPIYGLHNNAVLKENTEQAEYAASYKIIEFHNCEIDYNSVKTGWATVNNTDGIKNEYTIDILFDDCYEHMYNNVLMRSIGDMIAWDTAQVTLDDTGLGTMNYIWKGDLNLPTYELEQMDKLDERLNLSLNRPYDWFESGIIGNYEVQEGWDFIKNEKTGEVKRVAKMKKLNDSILPGHKGSDWRDKGFLENVTDNAIATTADELKTIGNRLLLGNLYNYSISKMASQLQKVINGNISAVIEMVDDYAGTNVMNTIQSHTLNSLANDVQGKINKASSPNNEDITYIGNIRPDIVEPQPAAAKPYTNSTFERKSAENTINHDIFPTIPNEKSTLSLGNLYKAKTLINNI